jgi:hypothetical protein
MKNMCCLYEVHKMNTLWWDTKSHDSSVSLVLGYELDDWGSRVRFLVAAADFPLHYHVQTGSGAHPASCPMGTRGSSLGVKWQGCEADRSPPSSAGVKEWVELYLHSPNTPSWHGAQLNHRDNFTFTLWWDTLTISLSSWKLLSEIHYLDVMLKVVRQILLCFVLI